MPQTDAEEIEYIKSMVGKYFPIYDVKVSYEALTLYINPVEATLERDFESLRQELDTKRYIPALRTQMGEHVIQIVKRPEMRTRSIWVNRVMLVATFISTVFAGAFLWSGYQGIDLFDPSSFLWGAIFFSIPLLSILGVHETGHYLMSERHGVDASLPFFIPSVPPLGTFGAFISMRDPMPNRRALLDIGVAGPLAGLAVTVPVTILGLFLTAQGDVQSGALGPQGGIGLNLQPLFMLFTVLVPLPEGVALHPTAFAAWVGFLVTAINLLPAGQLDGGHIARALLGDNARYLSYLTIGALFIMGLFFSGWLFFAIIILFLGLRHPPPLNDITTLGVKRKVVGAVALIILATTFVPVPVMEISPDHSFDLTVQGDNDTTVLPGEVAQFHLTVNNTGNTDSRMEMNLGNVPAGWGAVIFLADQSPQNATNSLEFQLPHEGGEELILEVQVLEDAPPGNRTLMLETSSYGEGSDVYQKSSDHFTVDVL
ncbi:MAG: site-2 protease family protein [Methanomassiliicoccales archaeon]